ncbi:unnamed protein product [Dibothriocephalus latus]|uniref:Major facilitator superfamily (MFS) profile domain-containing protein n=1 Tax=Dibothriocephalus latus TaxID=60516 RepID=A0A3P6TYW1_DIBLA|nr:unnamed protein product [Dibothriocephalus latus]
MYTKGAIQGLYAEVLGPALTTLMHDIPASYKEIGQALSVREVGMFFGSLLGAVLADRFVSRRSCTIAISQVVGAITIFAVAWCRNLPSLCATLFFSGCAHGALTSSEFSLNIFGCLLTDFYYYILLAFASYFRPNSVLLNRGKLKVQSEICMAKLYRLL